MQRFPLLGGSLTAWMRLKYPQIVNMGLAASAEFGYYVSNLTAHGMDEFTWIDIVNQDYQDAAPQCLETLTQGVAQVQSTGQSPSGLTQLTETFHLCKPLQDVQHLLDLITDALETMPQLDYPYAIGTLPAWPVNATCSMILDTKQDLISNLAGTFVLITFFAKGLKLMVLNNVLQQSQICITMTPKTSAWMRHRVRGVSLEVARGLILGAISRAQRLSTSFQRAVSATSHIRTILPRSNAKVSGKPLRSPSALRPTLVPVLCSKRPALALFSRTAFSSMTQCLVFELIL